MSTEAAERWKLNWMSLPTVSEVASHWDYSEGNPTDIPLPGISDGC